MNAMWPPHFVTENGSIWGFLAWRWKQSCLLKGHHASIKKIDCGQSSVKIGLCQREFRKFKTEWLCAFPKSNMVLISSWMQFWYVSVVPKYVDFAKFVMDVLATFVLWLCSTFYWWYLSIYFLSIFFTFRPAPLIEVKRVSVFLSVVIV